MKQAFKEIGKSYATAAAEIGCSKPMLVAVVNHGQWPKKGADQLRAKLKQYFETNGADIPDCLRNEPNAAPAPEDNDQKGKTLKAVHIAEAILAAVAPNVSPKRSPEARFAQIHRALQESAKAGNRHVLVIEEAHGLPIPTLKHLKRFFELKSGFERLLGIVWCKKT